MALGSVIAAWCFSLTGGNAPRRSAAGSRSARPVAMAYGTPARSSARHGARSRLRLGPRCAEGRQQFGRRHLPTGRVPSQGKSRAPAGG